MALSAIHLLNWFYSFSLNKLSLLCFCNWGLFFFWKIRVNPTWPATRLTHLKMTCFDLFDPLTRLIDPTQTWPDSSVLPRLIVRPHQWYITKGGSPAEKKFRRGISSDMTEGVVAASAFNASHQTSWLHLCGEDPWTMLSWPP